MMIVIEKFKTINKTSEGIYKEKGSKFLAYAIPVLNEKDIRKFIIEYRKLHHNARHHCYAYRLGLKGNIYKANDDNEPAYTAGKPILGQIDSFQLTNVLIIVIRYFGGTLLGKGGLINAYKSAAKDALNNAKIIEETVKEYFEIKSNYEDYNKIIKILSSFNIIGEEPIFDVDCKIKIRIKLSDVVPVMENLKFVKSIQIKSINST